jgi:hypothetical protein
MAKYTAVSGGFDIGSDSYVDKRLLLTKEEMKAAYDEWFMPERYIAYCLDDQQWYEYNENNEEDPETGFYRAIPSGIVKDVRIEGQSILDENGVADFEFPVEDVLVDGNSVVENKKAQIDLSGKQDTLIAGEGIQISDSNVISSTSVPKEGNGIKVAPDGTVSIDPAVVPSMETLPADVESITRDLGYITKAVINLEHYYLKDETYNKDEINNLLDQLTGGITMEVVAVLPITGESDKIYLVRRSIDSNVYDQYIWFNNSWVQVGSTEIDLSQYYTKAETDNLLNNKQDKLVAGSGINISNNVISADVSELPNATPTTKGVIKYDNVTIKKNADDQLYAVSGGEGTTYKEGENIYFTSKSGDTYINANGYTAGDGISISNSNKISAKVDDETVHVNRYGEIYMDAIPIDAGDGIKIKDGVLSVDRSTVPTASDLSNKQDKLVAGNNIQIVGNVISASGSGGGGGDVNWGSIYGSINNQADLMNILNTKANSAAIPTNVSQLVNDVPYATRAELTNKQDKLVAGANITISADNVISATGGGGGGEVNFSDLVGSPLDNDALAQQIAEAKASPAVYDGSFIVKRNGVSLGGTSANANYSTSVDIKVPTFSLSGTVLTITNN